VQALEEALAVSGDTDPAVRARLLAILAVELLWSGDPARCRLISDEALTLARRNGDPRVLGSAVALRWATLWHPRWAVERLQLADELLSLAEATGDPSFRFWGLWRRSLALMELADGAAAAESRAAAQGQASNLGQPFLNWCVVISRISAAVSIGQLDEAERVLQDVPDFRIPDADTLATAGLAGIRYAQGRLGELEPVLQDTVERLPRVPLFHALLALAYIELGRAEDARAVYHGLDGDLPELVFDYFAAPTAAVLASVCSRLDDTEGAAQLYDLLAPYANQVASHPGIWFGSYEHHLGLLSATLGRRSEAEAHFARAAETHQRFGATSWLERTQRESDALRP
jgi:tetratricopeptide (TPR) repeat protein